MNSPYDPYDYPLMKLIDFNIIKCVEMIKLAYNIPECFVFLHCVFEDFNFEDEHILSKLNLVKQTVENNGETNIANHTFVFSEKQLKCLESLFQFMYYEMTTDQRALATAIYESFVE